METKKRKGEKAKIMPGKKNNLDSYFPEGFFFSFLFIIKNIPTTEQYQTFAVSMPLIAYLDNFYVDIQLD